MKRPAKVVFNISLFILFAFLISCKEDQYEKIATLRFETNTATYSEDMSNVRIGLVLDRPRNVDFTLKAVWEATDKDSHYGGDFELSQEIKVKAFDTHPSLSLSILNDMQIDPDDHISVKLIDPVNKELVRLSGNPSENNFFFTITNNDQVPQDKLQADLTWSRANSHDNISDINFDLYLQSNVVYSNGVVTDIGNTVQVSMQPGGFETVWLKSTDLDQQYFLVVYFQKTLIGEKITFNLNLNGLGFSNKSFEATVDDTEMGAMFIGPFVKSGKVIQLSSGRSKNQDVGIFPVKRSFIKMQLPVHH